MKAKNKQASKQARNYLKQYFCVTCGFKMETACSEERAFSKEIVDLMLKNLLKEAKEMKSKRLKLLASKKEYDDDSNTARILEENNIPSVVKQEPETDFFEIEYFSEMSTFKASKPVSKLIVRLEKFEVIEKNGKFRLKSIGQALNRTKHLIQEEKTVKVSNNERIKQIEKINEHDYSNWSIKNEELDIKEEEQEENKTSVSTNSMARERPKDYIYPDLKKYKFTCKQCDYRTNQKRYLNKHLLAHNKFKDDDTFQRKKTVYKSPLKKHLIQHKKSKKALLNCNQCKYQTIQKDILKRHVSLHKIPENVKIFICDRCYYMTLKKSHLKIHIFRQHKKPKENVFNCTQCAYQTYSEKNLKSHLLDHLVGKDYRLKCNQCDYQTIYRGELKRHLILHKNPDEVARYKCEQCSYQTVQKANLKKHQLRHKKPGEVFTFKCNSCSYQTVRKTHLKRHLLRHNPQEVTLLKCGQCSYETMYKSALGRHLLRHKNLEESEIYECDKCKFQTLYKDNLLKHIRICTNDFILHMSNKRS